MKISPSQTAPASQGEARQAADAMATGAAFAHASADAYSYTCKQVNIEWKTRWKATKMGEDPTKMGENPTKIMVSHGLTV